MNQIAFPDSVENFTNAVAAFVALGYKASLSREAYNFFMANDGKLKEAVAMEAENAELDNDGADGEDGTDGEDGENSNTDVSITIKLSDKTICLRRTDGQLVSHNSKEDITTALASLIEDVESSLIYSAADAS